MNFSVMLKTLGWVLTFEGAFLSLPCLVALIYGEREGYAYLIVMGVCLSLIHIYTVRDCRAGLWLRAVPRL